MSLRTNKRIVLAKIESEYAADSGPAGANRIITSGDPSWTPYQGDTATRDRADITFGARAEVNVGPNSQLEITVPLAGSGQAGTAPVFGPLMRACGMSETINDGTSVAYQPVTDDIESVSIYYVMDGIKQVMRGARGTATLTIDSGGFPTIQFTMTSLYDKPITGNAGDLVEITQADEIPVNRHNSVASVHGHQACMSAFSIDLGNSVSYFNRINCENVDITDRETTGSLTIDGVRPDAVDYFKAVESHEEVALKPVTLTHGKTAGNIVEIAGPRVQLSSMSMSDDEGRAQFEFDTRFIKDQGDDELVITFK